MKITIIFERFIVLMWKDLNFQLFCFCYSLLNVGSVFTEAQPGPTLTALCFEIAHSLLRNIVEREFQILTLMNFHEPLQIKCNFQRPSSSDLPLAWISWKSQLLYDKNYPSENSSHYFVMQIMCISDADRIE